jgi:plastocyanin
MRRIAVGIAALSITLLSAQGALAAEVVTAPGALQAGFLPPVVVVEPGETLTYSNFDIAGHNVVASDAYLSKRAARKVKWCSGFPRGKCPLFWSPTVGTGDSTEVLGLQFVKAGTQYGFLCTLHPNMKGTLLVR